MSWAGKQHPLETLAELLAPALLAAASGWAAWSVSLPIAATLAVAATSLAAGFAAMRSAGSRRPVNVGPFEPVAIEPEELLLEAKDEVLLLDDPLIEAAPDSRVVRLFARPDPTPGELVERIADFLGDSRRAAPDDNVPTDASAALHAALSNIRASLR